MYCFCVKLLCENTSVFLFLLIFNENFSLKLFWSWNVFILIEFRVIFFFKTKRRNWHSGVFEVYSGSNVLGLVQLQLPNKIWKWLCCWGKLRLMRKLILFTFGLWSLAILVSGNEGPCVKQCQQSYGGEKVKTIYSKDLKSSYFKDILFLGIKGLLWRL